MITIRSASSSNDLESNINGNTEDKDANSEGQADSSSDELDYKDSSGGRSKLAADESIETQSNSTADSLEQR